MYRTNARRNILLGILGTTITTFFAGRAKAETAPRVASNDPMVASLGYVENATTVNIAANPTYKPGQQCGNCALAHGAPSDKWLPCRMFQDKLVNSARWCRVWVKKPS